MNELNRRNFIKRSATFAASVIVAPSLIPASALGKNGSVAPSDRINLVMIGSGNQGLNDMGEFLKDSRVQITGICDVNKMSGGYWNGGMGGREGAKRGLPILIPPASRYLRSAKGVIGTVAARRQVLGSHSWRYASKGSLGVESWRPAALASQPVQHRGPTVAPRHCNLR